MNQCSKFAFASTETLSGRFASRFLLLSPAVTSVPLFVTYGDISPRPERICPDRGKSFLSGGLLLQNRIAFPLMVKKLPLSGELPSECEAERVHNIKENNKL